MRARWFLLGSGLSAALAFIACGTFDNDTTDNGGGDAGEDVITGKAPGTLEATIEGDLLTLVTGRVATLKVTVARTLYEGPVDLSFKNLPPEIDAPKVTLDPEKQIAELKLTPSKNAKQGDLAGVELELASPTGSTKSSKPLKVFVRGAPGDLDTTFATNGVLKTPSAAGDLANPIPLSRERAAFRFNHSSFRSRSRSGPTTPSMSHATRVVSAERISSVICPPAPSTRRLVGPASSRWM